MESSPPIPFLPNIPRHRRQPAVSVPRPYPCPHYLHMRPPVRAIAANRGARWGERVNARNSPAPLWRILAHKNPAAISGDNHICHLYFT